MSYEMMEAVLVQKIAKLRQSEAVLVRSLDLLANGAHVIDLNAAHQRVHAQMQEVEHLLAVMNSNPAPAILPVDAPSQVAPSVWM